MLSIVEGKSSASWCSLNNLLLWVNVWTILTDNRKILSAATKPSWSIRSRTRREREPNKQHKTLKAIKTEHEGSDKWTKRAAYKIGDKNPEEEEEAK